MIGINEAAREAEEGKDEGVFPWGIIFTYLCCLGRAVLFIEVLQEVAAKVPFQNVLQRVAVLHLEAGAQGQVIGVYRFT